jgi:hypothetical protein
LKATPFTLTIFIPGTNPALNAAPSQTTSVMVPLGAAVKPIEKLRSVRPDSELLK